LESARRIACLGRRRRLDREEVDDAFRFPLRTARV
jgi:hypothetical protein